MVKSLMMRNKSHLCTYFGAPSSAWSHAVLIVFQYRDGRKAVPHVVSLTGNLDRGMMAFLSNSLKHLKTDNSKQKLQQRKVIFIYLFLVTSFLHMCPLFCDVCLRISMYQWVLVHSFQVLKLHPVLAPVKVALDISRGATVELRQVWSIFLLNMMASQCIIELVYCVVITQIKINAFLWHCRCVKGCCANLWMPRSLYGLVISKLSQYQWSSWTQSKQKFSVVSAAKAVILL